jgi:hypothetical protein
MLRRFTCVVLFVCFVLSGCSPITPTPSPVEILPAPNRSSQATYEIVTVTYDTPVLSPDDVINIRYPQIRGLGDDARENTINEMIERHIFDMNSDRLHVNSFDSSGNGGSYDINVVYHIMLQSAEILSIVYERELRYYECGKRSNYYHRMETHAYGITIDLENATRMRLDDFTRTDLPEESPGFDIYYRIRQSREVLGIGLEKIVYPEYENYPDYDPKLHPDEDTFWENVTVGVPFGGAAPYNFFVTQDSIYYINGPFVARGGYNFIKILDEAAPYELPAG